MVGLGSSRRTLLPMLIYIAYTPTISIIYSSMQLQAQVKLRSNLIISIAQVISKILSQNEPSNPSPASPISASRESKPDSDSDSESPLHKRQEVPPHKPHNRVGAITNKLIHNAERMEEERGWPRSSGERGWRSLELLQLLAVRSCSCARQGWRLGGWRHRDLGGWR